MADTPAPTDRGAHPGVFVDQGRPNPARVFSALLGGKDTYSSDQIIAQRLLAINTFRVAIVEARLFLLRAVEHLVGDHGVTQIVELGCGYPNDPTVHEVARNQTPTARTVYVDHDPIVAGHARALMTGAGAVFVDADLTDPTDVLERIGSVLEPGLPTAVCLSGTAEFLPDAPAIVASLTSLLPDGTWLVFTQTAADLRVHEIDSAVAIWASAGISYRPREREQVEQMLAPLRLLEPGVLTADLWRPDLDIVGVEDGSQVWPKPVVCCYAAVGQLRRR
ncbi:SAM-dependent methyltransferase [Nocardia sp. NPDC058379]|uniref:SAM-dependent methyltransferase n=1 Tax=unclassified Nocardia TaxID=2637762 RepID=UPI00365E99CA